MTVFTTIKQSFLNHDLASESLPALLRSEKRPLLDVRGCPVEGIFNCWIWLDNPQQLNSYTTRTLADLILELRRASNDPEVSSVVFTAVGERAFCTGGNTAEYSEHYSGRPDEYRRYMRLFNDLVSALLECDKPVINRVNGMRIGGGQELGLACDFSIAADTARFGQAGPKHGSAPVGGSTDFLPLYVGWARAVESCTLCEPWTAHQAFGYGLINGLAPVTLLDGEYLPNPLVVTRTEYYAWGRHLWGTQKT